MRFSNESIELDDSPVAAQAVTRLRATCFLLVCVLPLFAFWGLTRALGTLVLDNETFSHIPLIPAVSIYLIYCDRKKVFGGFSMDWIRGVALILPGVILLGLAEFNLWRFSPPNQGSLFAFGIVLVWIGMFVLFFGTHAFRAARFPLLFLIFAIPIPEPLISRAIFLLQTGSANVAAVLFQMAGVPYLRRGFIFQLPGFAILVAEECSGIRSTLALLITMVLASHLFLRSNWRRLLFISVVVPIAILKNGLRIATLSTLALYVNPSFLYGNLHRRGGIIFFLIALVPMGLLLELLKNGENSKSAAKTNG